MGREKPGSRESFAGQAGLNSTPIPDDERLFRFCDGNKVKPDGRVHWRAFYATEHPYQLSVDRESLVGCSPGEHAYNQGRSACAAITAGDAKEADCKVIHLPKHGRPSYSRIIVGHDGDPPEHKSKMSADQIAMLRTRLKTLAQSATGEQATPCSAATYEGASTDCAVL